MEKILISMILNFVFSSKQFFYSSKQPGDIAWLLILGGNSRQNRGKEPWEKDVGRRKLPEEEAFSVKVRRFAGQGRGKEFPLRGFADRRSFQQPQGWGVGALIV